MTSQETSPPPSFEENDLPKLFSRVDNAFAAELNTATVWNTDVINKNEPNVKSFKMMSNKSKAKLMAGIMIAKFRLHSKETTIHGIPNMVGEHGPMSFRIAWLFFFLASMGACAYFMYLSIADYLQYEVVSTMSVIDEIPSSFPMVSLCNVNSILTKSAYDFANYVLATNGITSDIINVYNALYFRPFFIAATLIPSITDAQRQAFGIPIDEFILMPTFNGNNLNATDFSWYYDGYRANCYTFNSGKNFYGQPLPLQKLSKSDMIYGMFAVLYLALPYNDSLSSCYGAHVVINNQTNQPNLFQGFDLPVGYQSNVNVKRTYIHRLSAPYSDCVNSPKDHPSELTDIFINNNLGYTQQDCFNYCIQRKIIDTCGCYTPIFPYLTKNTSPCLSFLALNCQSNVFTTFVGDEVTKNCSDDCPHECDSIYYDITVTSADFPTKYYCQLMIRDIPSVAASVAQYSTIDEKCEAMKTMYASINVYYNSLSYTFIDELAKTTLPDLISVVGGTLGLFLGASFLSVIEIFEIIARMIHLIFVSNNKTSP